MKIAKEKLGNHNKCEKDIDSLNQKEAQIIGLNIEVEDSRREFQVQSETVKKEKAGLETNPVIHNRIPTTCTVLHFS